MIIMSILYCFNTFKLKSKIFIVHLIYKISIYLCINV